METVMGIEIVDIMWAADFAARRHAGQRRKGASHEPYINHLLEVAFLLTRATDGNDAVLIMAGLLHDTIEDVGVTREEIECDFGADVADVVMEVTDDKSLPKQERKQLQVVNAPHKSDRAKMLKIADKISNLRAIISSPPSDWPLERRIAYFAWARDVVNGCRGVNAFLDRAFDEAYEIGLKTLQTS